MKTRLGDLEITIHYNSDNGLYYVPFNDLSWEIIYSGQLMFKDLYKWRGDFWVRLKTAQRLYQTLKSMNKLFIFQENDTRIGFAIASTKVEAMALISQDSNFDSLDLDNIPYMEYNINQKIGFYQG